MGAYLNPCSYAGVLFQLYVFSIAVCHVSMCVKVFVLFRIDLKYAHENCQLLSQRKPQPNIFSGRHPELR